MKKIYLYITAIALIFIGCESYQDPYADFSVSATYVEPDEPVVFTNYSTDIEYVEWNFGDGTSSRALNPSHRYSREGVYEVTLAAYNHGLVDYSYFTIEVMYTTLEVVVYDIDTDQLIVGMPVELYLTEYDWQRGSNMEILAYTDRNGSIIFKEMQDRTYFIWAEDAIYTNRFLPEFDINYIRTEPLLWARHNYFELAVEYLPVQGVYKQVKLTEKNETGRVYRERVKSKSYGTYKEWKSQLKK